jgi:hypothetical protein
MSWPSVNWRLLGMVFLSMIIIVCNNDYDMHCHIDYLGKCIYLGVTSSADLVGNDLGVT